MRIVIGEFMDEAAVATLAAKFDTTYDAELVDRRAELIAALADADALIVRNRTEVDRELLAAAPSLKVIGRLGVGLTTRRCCLRSAQDQRHPGDRANALAVASM
jgi:(S)-sulfolactate dehydrogenase